MTPVTAALTSFRDLDDRWGTRKGTAFLAFKRALPELTEGRDFVYLNAQSGHAEIECLRAAGRVYASSINVVMLTPSGVQKLAPPP